MLVGRAPELAEIAATLDEARRGRSAALCVQGEAGVGKTSLLEVAAASAAGFRVTRTRGVQAELGLGHGALLDLLTPLRAGLPDLPAGQRDALGAALGWTAGPVPGERFLVAAATVSLLGAAAEREPLLVAVDDVQWLDAGSLRAVAFAARRLRGDRVAFLLARRPPAPGEADELADLPWRELSGLDLPAARRLLAEQVADPLVGALVAATGGNPLGLLEAARALTPEQRRGSAPLPDAVPVGQRLAAGFDRVLRQAPAGARRALLLVACSSRPDAGPVVRALRAEGLVPEQAVADAERCGLLVTGPGTLEAVHPLLRAAALRAAPPGERRSAHAGLAAALDEDPELATRHRSLAVLGADDRLADDLARLAGRERGRRGLAAASALQEHAARLRSSAGAAASDRSVAAEDAWLAGDPVRARRLAGETLDGAAAPADCGRALLTLGTIEHYAGSVPAAGELLRSAAGCAVGGERLRALVELGFVGYRLGSPAAVAAVAAEVRAAADPGDPEQAALADHTEAMALAFGGRWAEARAPALRALERLESDPRLRTDARYLAVAALAPAWAGEPERAVPVVERRLSAARAAGALGVLPLVHVLVAGWALVRGDHRRAYAVAGEAMELGRELGYVADLATAAEVLAFEEAARGRHEKAAAALATARELGTRAGVAAASVQVHLVDAFTALCRGDLGRVVAVLEARIAADGGRLPRGDHELAVAPDLVEAYLGLGRHAEAAALAVRYAEAHAGTALPEVRAQAERLAGLVAGDDAAATAAFERSHEAAAAGTDPFGAARTRLLHGARLRRSGERVAARRQLRIAAEAFADMGLDGWERRAVEELAATGQRVRRGSPGGVLTSQETRVALLVARGMTNREVAAELFLSPRTVEHHVTAVLRKTGLRSRVAVAAAFAPGGERAGPGG
ncbi:AAA family ATPase [Geodermatophilus sp. SYSU D00758]